MKKRLILGDVHGHLKTVEEIYNKEKPDDVIILGDYWDCFHSSDEEVIECFKSILAMQEEHIKSGKGEFILLLGNHDLHYLLVGERYSGYRMGYAKTANELLSKALDDKKIQFCYVDNINKIVYTHGGVSSVWAEEHDIKDLNDINEKLTLKDLKFVGYNVYGNSPESGILWIRPQSLIGNMFKDENGETWKQVVGHTHVREGFCINDNLWIMDSLPHDYLIEMYDENDGNKIVSMDIVENKD